MVTAPNWNLIWLKEIFQFVSAYLNFVEKKKERIVEESFKWIKERKIVT
jgi:hypothetical protein